MICKNLKSYLNQWFYYINFLGWCFNAAGGVTDTPCPYKCISDRYHMPHCYTALEELIYTFGGPWLFGCLLFSLLILLALVLSVARIKFVSADELPGPVPARRGSPIDRSFPFLESLNEVLRSTFYISIISIFSYCFTKIYAWHIRNVLLIDILTLI